MKNPKMLPTSPPRNPVLRALLRRALTVGAGRHKSARKPGRQAEQRDLAQRVHESGAW